MLLLFAVMNTVLWFFLFFVLAKLFVEQYLAKRNAYAASSAKGKLPQAFSSFLTQESFDRSIDYTLAKNRFHRRELSFDALLLSFVIILEILPLLYNYSIGLFGTGLWVQSACFIGITMLLSLPGLPLDWWAQFKIEAAFGFNKSTQSLWIMDKIKGIALAFVLGVPLLWVLLKFHAAFPNSWWLLSTLALVSFQILLLLLYPRFILPLFNKLTPLESGELRDELMNLANQLDFPSSKIEVIDGSKRSGHSNAFFTGFGKFRHIVLYDTLIKQLSIPELKAVLAHEIGHYKRGHIPKRLLVSVVSIFVMLGSVAWLIQEPSFYKAFGFQNEQSLIPALLILSYVSGLLTFWTTPIMNYFSRKHEYEADDFAKDAMGGSTEMIESLRKLSKENLSNLTPDPLFSKFYYSHPTLLEREANLLKKSN